MGIEQYRVYQEDKHRGYYFRELAIYAEAFSQSQF